MLLCGSRTPQFLIGIPPCGQTTCPVCNWADAVFSIRRVNGLEGPEDFVVLHSFWSTPNVEGAKMFIPLHPSKWSVERLVRIFYFFFKHLPRVDTLEAAFYARMAPVGRNSRSVIMYKKRVILLEWGCVGGVYREKHGAVLYVVHTAHTRATWWLLVLPTHMYIHNPTSSSLFFVFFSYGVLKSSKFAAGTCLPHSPTDKMPFILFFLILRMSATFPRFLHLLMSSCISACVLYMPLYYCNARPKAPMCVDGWVGGTMGDRHRTRFGKVNARRMQVHA